LRTKTGAENVSAFLQTLGTMKVEYNACAEDEEAGIDQIPGEPRHLYLLKTHGARIDSTCRRSIKRSESAWETNLIRSQKIVTAKYRLGLPETTLKSRLGRGHD